MFKEVNCFLYRAFLCGTKPRDAEKSLNRLPPLKLNHLKVCLECGREFGYSWELVHSVRSNGAGASEPLHSARHPEVAVV